jgi:hypothetical protein
MQSNKSNKTDFYSGNRIRTLLIMLAVAMLAAATVMAEGNLTNSTSTAIAGNSAGLNASQPTGNKEVLANITAETKNLAPNATIALPVANFTMSSFVPKDFKVGEIQFNIQIQNTGNVDLKNLVAIITGRGFSMTDSVPIDTLKPGEKSYIIVMGNIQEEGSRRLSARISDKIFFQDINVIDPNSEKNRIEVAAMQRQDEQNKIMLEKLSIALTELKKNYTSIESDLYNKKNDRYDTSYVKLDELKTFLRNAESSIIVGDAKQANVSITLAMDEYASQLRYLQNAPKIKTSFLQILKDNIVVISSIAGALITIFSLYELLKKKKDSLYQKIKQVNVNADTRVVVEKKKKPAKT